jgi:hypothetical protein
MLSIIFPAEDASGLAKMADWIAKLKECEIASIHEWKIPCGGGIQLTIKLEGPVGFRLGPEMFDQAIRLLGVAKEGVKDWPGSPIIRLDPDAQTQTSPDDNEQ